MVSVMTVPDYGPEIRQCWERREVIIAAQGLIDEAYRPDSNMETSLAALNRRVDAAMMGDDSEVCMFGDALKEAIDEVDEIEKNGRNPGLNVGNEFPRLQALVHFSPRRFIVLGADTKMGKTSLGWKWAVNAALEIQQKLDLGTPLSEVGGVLGLTLEMDPKALALRATCAYAGIDNHAALSGKLTALDRERLGDAFNATRRLPIQFVATGGMTPAMIRMRATQAMRKFKGKIALIVIDHMQLLEADGEAARAGGAWAFKSIVNTLSYLPKLFNCPVLALSQLSGIAERTDKKPRLSDLAWGKALSQAADCVALLYRAGYYHRQNFPEQVIGEDFLHFQDRLKEWNDTLERIRDHAQLDIAANRHGPDGVIELLFHKPSMSFCEDPASCWP
jgi:replicative DNA helicase